LPAGKENGVNFGLMISFRNSSRNELSYSELYRKHLDLAAEAEQMGFDTIWLTEHHFVEDGYSPSLLPLAAAIASRTRKIRIGTFVLLMPLHNPLHVAEDAATVDVLSNGRLDLGLGQGYIPREFTGYNIPREERSRRLREGVEIVRRAFTEDRVTFEGKCYTVRDVTLYPKPVQKPHPPIWIGARSRPATERAARNGYHLAGTGAHQAEIYRQALRAAGRNPDEFNISQLRFGFIAAKKEKAWDECEHALHYLMTRYGQWIAEANDIPGDENFTKVPPVGQLRKAETATFELMVGTPDDAIAQLEAMEHYCTHFAFGLALPGIDPRKVRASMKLFAEKVIPHFRRKGRSQKRVASR
jgi:probable F420-dependent oxidoreductase